MRDSARLGPRRHDPKMSLARASENAGLGRDVRSRSAVRVRPPWGDGPYVLPQSGIRRGHQPLGEEFGEVTQDSSPVARAERSPLLWRGISSFRGRSRGWPRARGVALWSSARANSSAVSRSPSRRIVERCDGRGEALAYEDPAAPDAPRGKVATPCKLVDGRARDAEQLGHLARRQDVGACERASGRSRHLPKRAP
jgi:hypothetical protein